MVSIIMIRKLQILFLVLFLVNCSCVEKFVPVTEEEKELLVVQGLITDQQETDTIKLSKSLPLGQVNNARPVIGAIVTIADDLGSNFLLPEMAQGTYIVPPSYKRSSGRFYTLHIRYNNLTYESDPVEMRPVPAIDSLYYEKINIEKPYQHFKGIDACQIYLNTYDPANKCKFYRWDFTETWVLRLLFPVENQTCWITEKSHYINIKSTAAFNESRINRLPLNYITNVTDRLQTKYSVLVNQYSLSEEEYNYWDKLQNITAQVGSLYDVIPASVPGNMHCIESPGEKILGYFSVSAKTSKRIFIKDNFAGIVNHYSNCIEDTIPYIDPPGLGISVWILDDEPYHIAPFKVTTKDKGCADCTVRGSKTRPDFWQD